MDSELISVLIGAAIFIAAMFAESSKKKKRTTGKSSAPRSAGSYVYESPLSAPAPPAQPTGARPSTPPPFPLMTAVEGERVTKDADNPLPAPPPVRRRKLPPLPGGDIRAAIIWGEILRPKFDRV